MLRGSLVSLIAIALLAAPPVFAKGGGGGGNGGGNAGGGGKDGGNGQGNGNSGGKGNSDSGSRGGDGRQGGENNSNGGQGNGGRGGNGGGGRQGGGSANGTGSLSGGPGRGGLGSQSIGTSTSGSARSGVGEAFSSSPKASTSATNRMTDSANLPAPQRATSPTSATPVSASLAMRGSGAGLSLPSSLLPRFEQSGSERTGFADPRIARAGISGQIVQACRMSIATAALPFGAIRVDAASAGQTIRMSDGGLTAPIEVRVVYARASARQIRQSRVSCRLNAAGAVVALR